MPESKISIIILAAGSSSRMGKSKQLLLVDHEPLLRKTTITAIDAKVGEVIIVLGSQYEAHKKVVKDLPVKIIFNEHWTIGVGTSIKSGLRLVMNTWSDCDGVIISVCDQPFLTSLHFQRMVDEFYQKGTRAIASGYANTIGTPVLFRNTEFEKLLKIDDHAGAKKLIKDLDGDLVIVEFPKGEIDLDTPEDYNSLIK